MELNLRLPLNLQYFAEEVAEGANEMGAADPSEGIEVTTEAQPEAEETNASQPEVVQSAEENARYAAARREAEAELKRYQEQQRNIDAEFAKRFEGYSNPITGKPVRTQKDYLDALDAQERLAMNQKLQESGIDPSIIENAINNNPVVRQAHEILQRSQYEQIERDLHSDLAAITKLDANIKTVEDLGAQPYANEVVRLVNSGLSLVEAYKLANFENLVNQKSEASKQAAINQAKGKSHLSVTDGVSTSDGLVDIPAKDLEKWKAFYPDATMKELKEKYNRVNK